MTFAKLSERSAPRPDGGPIEVYFWTLFIFSCVFEAQTLEVKAFEFSY